MVVQLEARALRFEYPGPVLALRGLELELCERELLVVIGPNGSGKSTLLKCLSGLEAPSAGAVLLRGKSLRDVPIRERARSIAVVPQFLPSLPDVRVQDFVLGGRYAWFDGLLGASEKDHIAVRNAMQRADIADVSHRMMAELSGGQRQRVLLARALAQETSIFLVDEPTNSLDPEHQIRVFSLIEELVQAGRSSIVVTHDLNLASQFATRVLLMDQGAVVANGPVREVLRRANLEPVYGQNLHYGSIEDEHGTSQPFVLPWRVR
jgi:iron complex transport system ATP-binding protein